ncbi:MAG: ABC transporter permease [Planctomycetota bacterium]|nr:ABC transporter permease [Planctomycetota bacterium]
MIRVASLARRDLLTLFVSPVAWTIAFVFLLVMGMTFHLSLLSVGGDLQQLVAAIYGGYVFWFMMLVLPPLISMRTLAEERRSGSLEMLVTTGISDAMVITAKWISTWCFFMFLWLCLLPLWALLSSVGQVDFGVLLSSYLGVALVGAGFCAAGILASSLTSHPLASAGFAMAINLVLFLVEWLRFLYQPGDLELRWIEHFSAVHHIGSELTRGIVDLRVPIWWVSFTILMLFIATKVLERRRW